jgi:hypothetical protein
MGTEIKDPLKNTGLAKYYLFKLYKQESPLYWKQTFPMTRQTKHFREKALRDMPIWLKTKNPSEKGLNPLAFLTYCNDIRFNQPTTNSQIITYYAQFQYMIFARFPNVDDLIQAIEKLKGKNFYLTDLFEAIFFIVNKPIVANSGRMLQTDEIGKMNTILLRELTPMVRDDGRKLSKAKIKKIKDFESEIFSGIEDSLC